MTREEAVETARVFLHGIYGDGPPTIVIDPAEAVEHSLAWTVLFDSQEHIDTGDFTQAPLLRLVVVFKDKSDVVFHPSAYTVEESEAWLATGQRPQRLS
ncbi:YrhB domain-containing protein [Actinacidiphila oryziradicis]|jgi:hypothetical protein|uniref:Serine protease n=1 Tax=Actinacidiphila oryziradicis TaxID=2571141 RepID=A0A4U0SPQ5_9ACTN|nr:YrhB domain-containing protein [Actinacidiphila oryziradicis]MCW2872588.1 hypothetical protein [Actinacidiphila oryziradicis]TKA11163.1 serine protease [Actinacidiphila oryziradicis]